MAANEPRVRIPYREPGVEEIAGSLSREFGDSVEPRAISEAVARAAERYSDARIRQFVPILVRREVISSLKRTG